MNENNLSEKTFRYDLNDENMRNELIRSRRLVQKLNRINVNNYRKKQKILQDLFGHIGDGSDVNPNFYCDFGSHIHIGKNFFCNYNCTMLDIAEIHIGDNCLFAPNVSLYTAAHPIDLKGRLYDIGCGTPISIGNGVWIGGNSVILAGVTIADNAVIGAGSVVTRDVETNTVVAGNPAIFIRKIDENETNSGNKNI